MKYILVVTGWLSANMNSPFPSATITSMSYIKSFQTREACEAVGKELAPYDLSLYRPYMPPATYKCIEERE